MSGKTLLASGKTLPKGDTLSAVRTYFDRWINSGMPIFYIDDVLAGVSLVDLYRITGEEKYKAGADKMAEYLFRLERENADGAGSIPYRPSQKNGYVLADGVGMVCSFLVKYGTEFENVHSVELGLRQMRNMFLFGMDEKTGLPYHGFRHKDRIKYGIIGWGRAVGWIMMGLARSMDCLTKYLAAEEGKKAGAGSGGLADVCRAGYEECGGMYRRLFGAVRLYQKENGAFSWQLGASEGPEDSSATAMIAYAALLWMRQERSNGHCRDNGGKETDDWKNTGELTDRAAEYLAGCERDGKICGCLAECMGFAEYPQVYGAYPWSLGPGLGVLRKKGV